MKHHVSRLSSIVIAGWLTTLTACTTTLPPLPDGRNASDGVVAGDGVSTTDTMAATDGAKPSKDGSNTRDGQPFTDRGIATDATKPLSDKGIVHDLRPPTDMMIPRDSTTPPQTCGGTNFIKCSAGYYCERTACAADAKGICKPSPATCSAGKFPSPQCGCNGVTYYNDCLRQKAGISLRYAGICDATVGKKCFKNTDCADAVAAECALVFKNKTDCLNSGSLTGACWVMPTSCDIPIADNGNLRSCNGGTTTTCKTFCNAVGDTYRYYEDNTCGGVISP